MSEQSPESYVPNRDSRFELLQRSFNGKDYRTAEALAYELLSEEPANPQVNEILAYIVANKGDIQGAFNYLRAASKSDKCSPEALYYLAKCYSQKKDYEEAIKCYNRVLTIIGDAFEPLHELATAQSYSGDFQEAKKNYLKAASLRPSSFEVFFNLGRVSSSLSEKLSALKYYEHALDIYPDSAETHFNRGVVLGSLGEVDNAIISFDNALRIRNAYPEAHAARGAALMLCGRLDEAVIAYREAQRLRPAYAEAYAGLGEVFRIQKRLIEALNCFAEAFRIDSELPYLLGAYLHVKAQIADWVDFDFLRNRLVMRVEASKPVVTPFVFLSLVDDPYLQFRVSEIYSADKFPSVDPGLPPYIYKQGSKKIRLGYFSADFREHAVSYLSAEMFELHSKDEFEIFGFYLGRFPADDVQRRIASACDEFIVAGSMSDAEIISRARELTLDIAIDLGGYTQGARTGVFRNRVAPIQLSYLGYLGTMAADCYDYLIADPCLISPETRRGYSEKIIYLPTYQVNDSKRSVSEEKFSRETFGLNDSQIVYCCFNNGYKISQSIFEEWIALLKAVPNSVMMLNEENSLFKENLERFAESRGLLSGRFIFAPRLPRDKYLARYAITDLFLDTVPYNAGTTASDALWAGVPVLTVSGCSIAARMASSLLIELELPELITRSLKDYRESAIDLGLHPDKLSHIRKKLLVNRKSRALFNAKEFTRCLEESFQSIYETYRKGKPFEDIKIQR